MRHFNIHLYKAVFLLVTFILLRKAISTSYNRADRGLTDLLLESIPVSTHDAKYHRNNLTFVPIGVFTSNHTNMETIRLNSNLISDLADFCFSAVPSLEYLYIGR